MKVAFLDRDGTVGREYPDDQWASIEEPEFLPGTFEGMRLLADLGFSLIVVTNQCLINAGIISQLHYDRFTDRMIAGLARERITLTDIFYCPHRADEGCRCMKPRPGMIEQALQKYPEIRLEESFVAGDRPTDVLLADYFGMRSFSVGFQGESERCLRVASLLEVAELESLS